MNKPIQTIHGKIFSQADLSGGLNINTSKYEIADNEAVGLINFVFTESGILTSRKGYRKYTPNQFNSSAIYSMFRYYKKDESTKYFLATSGTSIYSVNTSGLATGLTCNETLSSNQRFSFAVLNDVCYMTNGANKPLAWSGTGNIRQMGIVAPTSAPTLAEGTSGNPSGTYYYKITYYNSTDLIESTGYTSAAITVSSKKIELTSIPTCSDPQVDYIRIYRTVDGGTTYYYVGAVADGTTTYSDNSSDATIQANASYGASDYSPPPTTAKFIEVAARRVYLAKNSTYKSRIYWSEIDYPEYFASTNYRDINPDDGDIISGLIKWNDMLYIFKENGTYCLTDPADPYRSDLREISKDIGCISPYSIQSGFFQRPVSKNDWILVPGIILNSRFGVMGFDGSTFHPLSERVQPILDALYEENKDEIVGFFNKYKYYLSYTPKEGTIVDGGIVTFHQWTTDSGNENKDATYSTDHGATYNSIYDARIDLSNTSATNEDIEVSIFIDWATIESDGKKQYYSQAVNYEIFFSYDSASTWQSKGVFMQYIFKKDVIDTNMNSAIYNFKHKFNDSSVTNVRLDYFNDYYSDFPHATKITLLNVSYSYNYTSSVISKNVVNNQILYYDSLHNAWSDWRNIYANCFCAWNGSGDKGEEFFGYAKNGIIYFLNTGYDDDGSEIFSLYQSKNYDVGNRAKQKRFNAVTFTSDIFSDILQIEVFIDRVQRNYWKIPLLPAYDQQLFWNEEYHGKAVFDSVINHVHKYLKLAPNSSGRYISIKLWKSSKSELQIKDFSIKYYEREGIR